MNPFLAVAEEHPASASPTELVFRLYPNRRRARRIVDVVIASLAAVLLTPIVGAAAIAIYLEDGFPILFLQRRPGRYGRLFTIYKLRTMRRDAGDQLVQNQNDERILRVGRILRKTSIDELPQLINVFRGEMALIGPRPETAIQAKNFERWQQLKFLVDPGVTGHWQTVARKTIPNHTPAATMLDIHYVRERSPLFDLKIFLRTIMAIIRPKGAF